MKRLLISIFSLFVLNFPSAEVTPNSNTNNPIFVHVLYRHGDRNINKKYPNDPYKDEIFWPEGYSQLTLEGKRQLYELGLFYRRRYDKLLGDRYSSKNVVVQSTDVDRTIMSAQANLAAVYPPIDEDRFTNDIDWQPIPVHTLSENVDNILGTVKECPKYDAALKAYMKQSQEVKDLIAENKDNLLYWSEMCGSKIKTLKDVRDLHKTLFIEQLHNLILPDWALKAIEPNGPMERIAFFERKLGADTNQLARLKSGFLLKEMLEHFSQKINATLKPDRSIWFYSAHEETITNMLNSLGLLELHFPPVAASLHFELFKPDQNEHYIQIFYRKTDEEYPAPMNIPGCGPKCPLNQFYALYESIIPGDFDSECY